MTHTKQTRKSLIDKVYADVNNTVRRSTVEEIVNKFLDAMSQSLQNGDKIEIRGLGVFSSKMRKRTRRFDFVTKTVIAETGNVRHISFLPSPSLTALDKDEEQNTQLEPKSE